jgi:hypothetical protein
MMQLLVRRLVVTLKMPMTTSEYAWWYRCMAGIIRDFNNGTIATPYQASKEFLFIRDGIVAAGYTEETYREIKRDVLSKEMMGHSGLSAATSQL